ncbi:MAG TPA: ATP-binding protein [Spirochaetia bacterium]|nr:ATP-binding protein [Spirochaetia bacterium]
METGNARGRQQGPASRISLAALAVSVLVGVAALLAALFGLFYYRDAMRREDARLEAFSRDLAGQVADNLGLPVWSLDLEQADRIMMSAMSAREVAGIFLSLANVPFRSTGFVRQPGTGIVPVQEEPAGRLLKTRGVFVVNRAVVMKGLTIGLLHLYVSEQATVDDLKKTLSFFAEAMSLFCLVLSGCQFLLLWLLVLRPVRAVNDFAAAVMGGRGGLPAARAAGRLLPREIGVLDRSLRTMVELLDRRYEEVRASEARARESEAHYRDIFHRSPVSLWEEDISGLRERLAALRRDGVVDLWRYMDEHPDFTLEAAGSIVVRDVNDAAMRMFAAERREQLLGRLEPTIDVEARGDFQAEIMAIAQGNALWERESTARSLDGRTISILASASIPRPEDTPQHMLVSVLDVSERKRMEQALRDSELRYRTFIDASSDGIVRWELHEPIPVSLPADHQVQLLYERAFVAECNASAAAIYGAEGISDLLGEGLERSFPRSEPSFANALLGFVNGKYRLRGAESMCEDSALPSVRLSLSGMVENGRLARLWGVIQDLRAAKRADREKRALEEQLQQSQKMEAIGQLAGGIAHDFNNILAAIIMNIELLREDAGLAEGPRDALRDLLADAHRAANLTRQLLMFSRRSVLDIRVLDLNDVVSNLLKMLARLLGEHIQLELEPCASLSPVEADRGMIEQVITNLAVNARDAMPRGGRILIRTDEIDVDDERAAGHPHRRVGRFVCFSISDTGQGMDPATLGRIFEPFFTTKPEGAGTGLGLSTVHGIVAQHRGWVEVESAPGAGTTFRIFLPSSPKGLPPGRTDRAREVPRGNESVLVVEDDRSVRTFAVRALLALGYRTYQAANAQEALSIWQDHGSEIALVLTDMVMPGGMTGLELAGRLRAGGSRVKVIVSSGYSLELAHTGTPSAEGIVYLSKPYEVAILGETVRRCLDGAP